jgi:hypothetical protein
MALKRSVENSPMHYAKDPAALRATERYDFCTIFGDQSPISSTFPPLVGSDFVLDNIAAARRFAAELPAGSKVYETNDWSSQTFDDCEVGR